MAMKYQNRKTSGVGKRGKGQEERPAAGFVLLIAVIFMSVMLTLGLALGSLGYKQSILASSAVESASAFYAADAALECALIADQQNNFFTNPPMGASFACNGQNFSVSTTTVSSRLRSVIRVTLGAPARCADITVYKSVSTGSAYLFSQGYSVSCADVNAGNVRFVSRGISSHY